MDDSQHTNPFTGKRSKKGIYMTKKRKELLERYNNDNVSAKESQQVESLMKLYELSKMKTSVDEQFKDLKRSYGRGVLEFSFKGVGYYNAKKIILLGSSGSGKSTQVLNMLAESPNAFECVHVICPESTINNEVYTTLRYYCNQANILFYWSDSDSPEKLEFGDANEKDKRGSSKYLYDNNLGMFIIFDDTYKDNKSTWVKELMSDCFIKYRHRLINTIVCLQSPNYTPSTVALNFSHLFISGNFLERNIWSKYKMVPPDNLKEAIEDYNNTQDKRHQFYYIKNDDCEIHKYIPYSFANRQQIINKFRQKLPKGINDVSDIKAHKKDDEDDEEIMVTDQTSYEQKQQKEIKNRPDTLERNIKSDLKKKNENKPYYIFNGHKLYL